MQIKVTNTIFVLKGHSGNMFWTLKEPTLLSVSDRYFSSASYDRTSTGIQSCNFVSVVKAASQFFLPHSRSPPIRKAEKKLVFLRCKILPFAEMIPFGQYFSHGLKTTNWMISH